jgi:hypothetical protein
MVIKKVAAHAGWAEPIPTCMVTTSALAAVNSPGARQLLVSSSVRRAPKYRTFLQGATCAKQLRIVAACRIWNHEHFRRSSERLGMLTVTCERPLAVVCAVVHGVHDHQTDACGW